MASTSTTVRHITKDHILITPAKGYSVTTFNIGAPGNDVEAFVLADDGSETIRLLIAGPAADQTMAIHTEEDGVVSIRYYSKKEATE